MSRYIDANALYDNISDLFVEYLAVTSNNEARNIVKSLYKVILDDLVDNAPTVSPDEVRGVGRWIKRFDGPYGRGRTYCSACGKHSGIGGIKQTPPYCPNCGARMEVTSDVL